MRDKWNDVALPSLIKLAKLDDCYQELLTRCYLLEEQYCKIIANLSDDDRSTIDEYIAACEEMQYQMTQLAYRLGMLDNQNSRTV